MMITVIPYSILLLLWLGLTIYTFERIRSKPFLFLVHMVFNTVVGVLSFGVSIPSQATDYKEMATPFYKVIVYSNSDGYYYVKAKLPQLVPVRVCYDSNCVYTVPFCYEHTVPIGARSGDGVFLFYDDFNGNDLNTSKWQCGGGTWLCIYYKVANGTLAVWSDGKNWRTLYSKVNFSRDQPFAVEWRVMSPSADYWHIAFITDSVDDRQNRFGVSDLAYPGNDIGMQVIINGTATTPKDLGAMEDNTWYRIRIYQFNRTHYRAEFLEDNGSLIDYYENDSLNFGNEYWKIQTWKEQTSKDYFDWVRVYKIANPEPTVSVENFTVIINNSAGNLSDFQISFQTNYTVFAVRDENSNYLPFCYEHTNGECDSNPEDIKAIWVKANLTDGINTLEALPMCNNIINGWDGYIYFRAYLTKGVNVFYVLPTTENYATEMVPNNSLSSLTVLQGQMIEKEYNGTVQYYKIDTLKYLGYFFLAFNIIDFMLLFFTLTERSFEFDRNRY